MTIAESDLLARVTALENNNKFLRAKIADQEEVIDSLKTDKTKAPTAEEKKAAAAKLLERYPRNIDLKATWPESHLPLFPSRLEGPAKPTTLELGMEQNCRTYQKLAEEKKEGQKTDYTSLTDIFVFGTAYAKAVDRFVQEDAEEDLYAERYARYFNGLHDVFALAARRLAYIQVKTHTDEFDAAFSE